MLLYTQKYIKTRTNYLKMGKCREYKVQNKTHLENLQWLLSGFSQTNPRRKDGWSIQIRNSVSFW